MATDLALSEVAVGAPGGGGLHRRKSRRSPYLWGWISLGLVLWAVSLPNLASAKPSTYGLLYAARPTFVAAMVVLLSGYVWSVRRRDHLAMGAVLFGVILVQRVTVTLATSLPIYTWTYKHLGVVDYLHSTGGLAGGVDVYNEWPGLFSATAWFSDVTGVSPLVLAHWWAPAIHVLTAALVVALGKVVGLDRTASITAALVVELFNWVGQDYFSPQAIGYVLALAVLVLTLGYKQSKAAPWLATFAFAALVVTHQLTPYWIIGLTVLLALTGRIRPRWLPLLFAAIAIGFLYPRLGVVKGYGLFSGSSPTANVTSNVPTVGTAGRQLTQLAVRGLAIVLWLATGAAALWQMRRREPVLVGACILISSSSLLLAQSYGGEAIFRVFLYALPGCGLILGQPWCGR